MIPLQALLATLLVATLAQRARAARRCTEDTLKRAGFAVKHAAPDADAGAAAGRRRGPLGRLWAAVWRPLHAVDADGRTFSVLGPGDPLTARDAWDTDGVLRVTPDGRVRVQALRRRPPCAVSPTVPR